jgi:hypothetical protein
VSGEELFGPELGGLCPDCGGELSDFTACSECAFTAKPKKPLFSASAVSARFDFGAMSRESWARRKAAKP